MSTQSILQKFLIAGEIIITSGRPSTLSNAVSRAVRAGELRRIATRIYALANNTPLDEIVSRHRYKILATLFPSAVISHRSAIEGGVAGGRIVITGRGTYIYDLPGLKVHSKKGPPAENDDLPFPDGLFCSSLPRAWLENLMRTRSSDAKFPRTVPLASLQHHLERYFKDHGREEFQRTLRRADELSRKFSWDEEFCRLSQIAQTFFVKPAKPRAATDVGSLLASTPCRYNSTCDARFASLFEYLVAQRAFLPVRGRAKPFSPAEKHGLAFFDAYFSNDIDAVRFTLGEAQAIVGVGQVPDDRPEGHEFLGTYQLLMKMAGRARALSPVNDFEEFADELLSTHAVVMASRSEAMAGRLRDRSVSVGQLQAVPADRIGDTLERGVEYALKLPEGFPRAVFFHFVVTAIRPFLSGNGRVARLILNRELYRKGQWPIMIPTVFRGDYIDGLRTLSQSGQAQNYVRSMSLAQELTSKIDFTNTKSTTAQLTDLDAFEPSEEKRLRWDRLMSRPPARR